MKNTLKLFIGLLVMALMSQVALAGIPLKDFAGTWQRENSKDGITKMSITLSGEKLKIQTWGDCTPTDCDWGTVYGQPATTSVSGNYNTNTTAVLLEYSFSHADETLLLTPVSSKRIKVETFTRFKDSRKNTYKTQYMKLAPAPPPPTAIRLGIPEPVSGCGATYDHFPRKTTIMWTGVSGATSYVVDIDCLHCCKSGKWCSEVGEMWKTEKVQDTSYTFSWVGANKGRWRVSAIDKLGKKHAASDWCYFDYTR